MKFNFDIQKYRVPVPRGTRLEHPPRNRRGATGMAVLVSLLGLVILASTDGPLALRQDSDEVPTAKSDAVEKEISDPNESWLKMPTRLPEWTRTDKHFDEQYDYYVLKTVPHLTPEEASGELDRKMLACVGERLVEQIGPQARYAELFKLEEIRDRFLVKGHLIQFPCVMEIDDDARTMHRSVAELRFGKPFAKEVQVRWVSYLGERRGAMQRKRLLVTVVLAGSVLAFLATIAGYFRLDESTRGFYTRRLQTFSFFAVLIVAVVTYWAFTTLLD